MQEQNDESQIQAVREEKGGRMKDFSSFILPPSSLLSRLHTSPATPASFA
jgi:hypothetical protein